jgi:hypothetical protein
MPLSIRQTAELVQKTSTLYSCWAIHSLGHIFTSSFSIGTAATHSRRFGKGTGVQLVSSFFSSVERWAGLLISR